MGDQTVRLVVKHWAITDGELCSLVCPERNIGFEGYDYCRLFKGEISRAAPIRRPECIAAERAGTDPALVSPETAGTK